MNDDTITWDDVLDLADAGKLPVVAVDEDTVALLWWEPQPGHEHLMHYETRTGRACFAIAASMHCRERHGMNV